MEPYAIALLSLAGSVIAAIFAWTQAVRTAKLTTSSTETIERLKLEADRRKRAVEGAIAESRPLEAALDELWSDLQFFKDAAMSILDGAERNVQLEQLRIALEHVTSGYRIWAPRISEEAKLAWHGSRNTCSVILQLFSKTDPLTESDREMLRDLRQTLGDRQMLVARERHRIRAVLADVFSELI